MGVLNINRTACSRVSFAFFSLSFSPSGKYISIENSLSFCESRFEGVLSSLLMAVQRKRQLQQFRHILSLSAQLKTIQLFSPSHTHTQINEYTHTYSFNSSQPYTHIPADNLKAHTNTNQISHVHTLSFSWLLSTRTHMLPESFSVPEASECTLCVFLH